jgi:pimeloyl-ACP methyl ester carboxylesterase
VLTAGVSAAMLAGAGAANADTDAGSDPGPARTSSPNSEKPAGTASADAQRGKPRLQGAEHPARAIMPRISRMVEKDAAKQTTDAHGGEETPALGISTKPAPLNRLTTLLGEVRDQLGRHLASRTTGVKYDRLSAADIRIQPDTTSQVSESISSIGAARSAITGRTPALPTAFSALPRPDLISLLTPLVNAVLSPVLDALGALAQVVDGPPIVPPQLRGSIVESSSTLVVAPGTEVPADWYFPTQGEPERLIYLQHGFGATGPMYSYTASYLAERTNSVVVVTTLSPNWLAADGMSLEGDNMHKAIAQLLLDPDREALNASLTTATLKAGRESCAVPQQFVLVGHSAGGGFAAPVAGYYAEGLVARRAGGQDAPNNLAGVVLLDGVTVDVMPSALDRLKQLELSNGNDPADYVPIYQLGAPPNVFNSVSTAINDLSAARPGQFIGVVVNGGVHMDSMLGGNRLVQAVAYLIAGIPRPQNPPGVQWLMAGWINDMFEGNIDPVTGRCLTDCDGAYGSGGETIDIDGDHGNATAVVIDSGSLPDESAWNTARFTAVAASFIPASVLSRGA